MPSLDGRVALVTGASRGLGRDIALALARAGASVAVAARTDQPGTGRIPGSLAETVDRIRAAGGQAIAVHADVTRPDDITRAVETTIAGLGRLDILVNNAGVLIPGAVGDVSLRHWELAFRINVTGPFLLCQAAIPHLQRGGGHIINISSRAAEGPGIGPYAQVRAGGTVYGSTKAALERFSQGLAAELFPLRIAVNVLSPYVPIWSDGGHYFRTQSGEPSYSGWRLSGAIMGDAAVLICNQEPGTFTGNVLYDFQAMGRLAALSDAEIAQRYPVEA